MCRSFDVVFAVVLLTVDYCCEFNRRRIPQGCCWSGNTALIRARQTFDGRLEKVLEKACRNKISVIGELCILLLGTV